MVLVSAIAVAVLAACGSDTAGSATAPSSQPSLAAGGIDDGARRADLSCSVTVTYVFAEQNGTVVSTEPYQKDFVVQPGAPFVDDFSTPTRQKQFRASVVAGAGESVVTMNYFNDVGVFHSIDLTSTLTLGNKRASETASGGNTFSTSVPGLNGHHSTDYALTCQKA